MNSINAKLKSQIKSKIDSTQFKLGTTIPIGIEYNLKGTCAAKALAHGYTQGGTIQINPYILVNNIDTFLKQTIPHEICHIVAALKFRKNCKHGIYWKSLMKMLRLPPNIYHNYDITNVRPYIYECDGCLPSQQYHFSKNKHTRAQNGNKYNCVICGHILKFKN